MMDTSTKRRMLFIVEGKKTEHRLIESTMAALGLDEEYEVVPYGTNIHELFDVIDREYDGLYEDVDIRSVLAEAHPEDRETLSQNYTDLFLIFDYDPQDNRFNPLRLEKLIGVFTESTDRGKLYINYPMAESYKHFSAFDERTFLHTCATLQQVKDYKKYVASCDTLINAPEDLKKDLQLPCVIALNVAKVEHITHIEQTIPYENLAQRCTSLDLKRLLMMQNEECEQHGRVFICNTSIFFAADWQNALNGMWHKILNTGHPNYIPHHA